MDFPRKFDSQFHIYIIKYLSLIFNTNFTCILISHKLINQKNRQKSNILISSLKNNINHSRFMLISIKNQAILIVHENIGKFHREIFTTIRRVIDPASFCELTAGLKHDRLRINKTSTAHHTYF